jgi:pyridoxamine 5'-phosphate oxidase
MRPVAKSWQQPRQRLTIKGPSLSSTIIEERRSGDVPDSSASGAGGETMTREQIIEFLNANPMCHLATCAGSQPRVRGMMMYRADSSGLMFHTGDYKALAKQLLANKHVEACFNSQDTQVRVAGVVEIVEDMGLKKEIVAARSFLKPWVEKHGYDLLVVFRVTQCQAAVWTMATNFEPTRYQKL